MIGKLCRSTHRPKTRVLTPEILTFWGVTRLYLTRQHASMQVEKNYSVVWSSVEVVQKHSCLTPSRQPTRAAPHCADLSDYGNLKIADLVFLPGRSVRIDWQWLHSLENQQQYIKVVYASQKRICFASRIYGLSNRQLQVFSSSTLALY